MPLTRGEGRWADECERRYTSWPALAGRECSPAGGCNCSGTECPPFAPPFGLNSGVVLFDLHKLRSQGADAHLQAVRRVLAEYPGRLRMADQDVYNVLAFSRGVGVRTLPCRWNVRTDSLCRNRSNVGLMHGSRWSLHHQGRPFSKAWLKLADLAASLSAGDVATSGAQAARAAIRALCNAEGGPDEPWPWNNHPRPEADYWGTTYWRSKF